jgi:hypothetical protein
MMQQPPKYSSFEAPKEMPARQENIHINLVCHTTMKTPPMDQPALDVALDAQLQAAVSSSQIITAKKATVQVVMKE